MATTDTATTSEMLAAARVDAGHDDAIESAEWMNQIIAQLWPFISAFIETTLKRDVEPLVNAQVPDWLGSIAFGTVSLGATPLRIEGLDVIATGPAGTRLEADVYYDGDAQVSIDVVTKFLGTLSLGVQSIKLDGSIQFVMNPLVPVLPLMAATQLAFINRPTIAMDLTGLADVDRAASIKAIISNTIVDVLSGLLVLPNRVAAKVDPAADYFATYVAPAGVLRGTIAAGRDFRAASRHVHYRPARRVHHCHAWRRHGHNANGQQQCGTRVGHPLHLPRPQCAAGAVARRVGGRHGR
eukprot:TRINITY_DN1958_c0_g1_i2.p1 TRINITY_DN1958_c0_g1~~TRINITY_DN1958_c0_g1_i2.p1  ORF type:complete len:343 (-),score=97.16 TRINITY_DN1958_c0_g1_i2:99-989(-)